MAAFSVTGNIQLRRRQVRDTHKDAIGISMASVPIAEDAISQERVDSDKSRTEHSANTE